MLSERIKQALTVLGGDETVRGTLREQASAYLGEPVEDVSLRYIKDTAKVIYEQTLDRAEAGGYPEDVVIGVSLANVLIAGMALGKRLGIEDGEQFARQVGTIEDEGF